MSTKPSRDEIAAIFAKKAAKSAVLHGDEVREALNAADYIQRAKEPFHVPTPLGRALLTLAAEVRRLQAELAGVRAGWRLVPVEHTPEMRAAFQGDGEPHMFFRTTIFIGDFDERYRAMLAAAPPAPTTKETPP